MNKRKYFFQSGSSGLFPIRRKRISYKRINTARLFQFISPLPKDGKGVFFMAETEKIQTEKRIAVVSILVMQRANSEKVNALLSEYGEFILGRM